MNDEAVRELARKAGIAVDWTDANNRPQRVSAHSLRRILASLDLDLDRETRLPRLITTTLQVATPLPDLRERTAAELALEGSTPQSIVLDPAEGIPPIAAPGYHRLRYGAREVTLAVAPPRCLTISDILEGRKSWGLAVQLYSLRRTGDGGIGDTAALTALAQSSAKCGADAIAISPAHSLFPHDLSRYQPYSPSSRLFLNPLLADPAAVLGEERVAAASDTGRISDDALIDWPTAAAAKYALLRRLFDRFELQDLAKHTALASAFIAFVREGGRALDDHARFEVQQDGWKAPALYYAFLQWIAFGAFVTAQAAAKAAGMDIGIIGDLAIGVDRSGSQVNARPHDFLEGLSIGAPPDAFNPQGQDWGLTTFAPQALIANGFDPFIATVRANMRYCGGLRIDHAMGLMRLWLVPHGAPPSEGAYVACPFDDLLRLLALESYRNGAIVIGEDLGTVPPGFRRRCRDAGIAGMDVLWFQRDGTHFLSPGEWRDDAVAMTTTHDLPTVAGWWQGADLDLRRDLGLAHETEVAQRQADRASLWQAFTAAGSTRDSPPPVDQAAAAVDTAVAYVARTSSPLTLLPIEDAMGLIEQPNLPGTTDEQPNWRRRLDLPASELLRQPAASCRVDLLARRKR